MNWTKTKDKEEWATTDALYRYVIRLEDKRYILTVQAMPHGSVMRLAGSNVLEKVMQAANKFADAFISQRAEMQCILEGTSYHA